MIPYGRQSIDASDIQSVLLALQNELITTGPIVDLFENQIEKLVGAKSVVVSSGTAALHCAFAAIGIEQGDEVITPPLTFIATQATAALLGAKIVFVDVQEHTGNIDPNLVEAAITSRTKAIVAVDYAGHPADLLELRAIADKHGIFLIEDAAHSLGSIYRGSPVGAIADITTFSFFPTKNITTGEGGAISSNNLKILERAKRFGRQGLVRNQTEFKLTKQGDWHQEVHEFGLNYRLPDVLCALGISQLSRIATFKKDRADLFATYQECLGDLKGIQLPIKMDYVDPMWHLFPIKVKREKRTEIFNQLRGSNIGVQVNYLPAHLHPVFSKHGFKEGDFPISEEFYSREISLPMMASNSDLNKEYFQKIARILQ